MTQRVRPAVGEAIIMAITLFVVRRVFVLLDISSESWLQSVVIALVFGVVWVVLGALWRRLRPRRASEPADPPA